MLSLSNAVASYRFDHNISFFFGCNQYQENLVSNDPSFVHTEDRRKEQSVAVSMLSLLNGTNAFNEKLVLLKLEDRYDIIQGQEKNSKSAR